MGRLPKKPSLYARCEELGIEYNEKMSIKELEDLISKNTKTVGREPPPAAVLIYLEVQYDWRNASKNSKKP